MRNSQTLRQIEGGLLSTLINGRAQVFSFFFSRILLSCLERYFFYMSHIMATAIPYYRCFGNVAPRKTKSNTQQTCRQDCCQLSGYKPEVPSAYPSLCQCLFQRHGCLNIGRKSRKSPPPTNSKVAESDIRIFYEKCGSYPMYKYMTQRSVYLTRIAKQFVSEAQSQNASRASWQVCRTSRRQC